MIVDVGFAVLAALTVLASGLVATARNLVHAVFWLAAALVVSAGLMVWLDAPFVAGIQIVLYTGGVTTVMIFAVMLTNREATTVVPNPVRAPGSAALTSMTVLGILLTAIWTTRELEPDVVAARSIPAMRAFDAHLRVERALPELAAPETDGEITADAGFDEPTLEERRLDTLVALRDDIAEAMAASGATELSDNEDTLEPVVRIWLRLDDPSELSRDAATRRLEAAGARVVDLDVTAEVGRHLLTDHLLAFEALSVLLLAAMIGAIVLSRRKDP